jgi:hypothetical protein
VTSRFGLISVIAGALLLVPSASAAVAPLEAPLLTSVPSAAPVSIHWTPAALAGGDAGDRGKDHGHGEGEGEGHGHGHGHGGDGAAGSIQAVLRADGPCASPVGPARVVAIFADSTTSDFSDAVPDGTYCYSIAVADAASAAASPGLTVVVAALSAIAASPSTGPVGGAGTAPASVAAPRAQVTARHMAIGRPRVRVGARGVHVTVQWTDPIASGLERVDIVMNSRRPPRDATDGTVVYRGRGTSIVLQLRAGQTRYLALFASDAGGTISAVARRVVSLASLVPLRPISGSSVSAAPLLTWKPWKGASYYNLQLFRNGRRVLIAWPSRPSFRVPAAMLRPGTYVWFVWPALQVHHTAPRFADLIGRATFDYVASGTAQSQ